MKPDWIWRWKDSDTELPAHRLKALANEFQIGFLEAALQSNPENTDLLLELGEVYTLSGQIRRGLAIDTKLARLLPDDPMVLYNFACSLALTGQPHKALKNLHKAVLKGFTDFSWMEKDPDLASLRDQPAYQDLVHRSRKALS